MAMPRITAESKVFRLKSGRIYVFGTEGLPGTLGGGNAAAYWTMPFRARPHHHPVEDKAVVTVPKVAFHEVAHTRALPPPSMR
jgi:hypothetical protein